jgi:hypothetical protein
MVKSISKITNALMVTAIIMLVTAACRKQQSVPVGDSLPAGNQLGLSIQQIEGIPDSLKVPEGNRLVEDGFAVGVQIYQVQRSPGNPNLFVWVNVAPLATLYSKSDLTKQVALHFAGPSWELTSGPNKGQRVVARRLRGVTEDVTAIQWLLLQTVDSLSSANNKINFVQRIFTEGGLAPSAIPDEAHLGQMDSIPYTARYLFYEAKH